MKQLPTVVAENIYTMLEKKLGVSRDHYEREAFIYHYGVVTGAPKDHRLLCKDGQARTFFCSPQKKLWVEGPGTDEVNLILKQVSKSVLRSQQLEEFTVSR